MTWNNCFQLPTVHVYNCIQWSPIYWNGMDVHLRRCWDEVIISGGFFQSLSLSLFLLCSVQVFAFWPIIINYAAVRNHLVSVGSGEPFESRVLYYPGIYTYKYFFFFRNVFDPHCSVNNNKRKGRANVSLSPRTCNHRQLNETENSF